MKKVLVVFFSGNAPGAFKGGRVKNYIDLLAQNEVDVFFLGLRGSIHSKKVLGHKGQVVVNGSLFANLADLLFFRWFGWCLPRTFRRSVLCDLISFEATRWFRKYKPDVVLTQPYFFRLVSHAKSKDVKVFLECDSDYPQYMWDMLERSHDDAGLRGKRDRDPWDYYPYVNKANKAIAYADKVIVFSEHAKRTFLAAGVVEDKLLSATPPVSCPINQCGIVPSLPEFVWIGNHGARKGLHILMQAWEKYKKGGGSGKLYICGEVSRSQKKLRKNLLEMDDVEMHEKIDVSSFFISGFKVMVSVSYSEGFPRTVLEAMQHGCPVIANDVGGGSIMTHGHDGWVVELNSDSLCDGFFLVERNWKMAPAIGAHARSTAIEATNDYYERVLGLILED